MAVTINASTTSGLVQSADTTGIIQLQSNGTTVQTINGVTTTYAAGTSSNAPIVLTSGTNLTTATAGAIEYNGTILQGTPISTQRGIIPTEQFFSLNSGLAGSNATGAQNIFGVGVTLAGSTQYEFELEFILSKTAGTTSHTISLGFGGTATLNNIQYNGLQLIQTALGPNFGAEGIISTVATATVVTNALTSATSYVSWVIKGTVSINAGGTFIPQYTLSAAPGGAYTTQAGSYMKIKPLRASGANVSVGTWA